MPNQGDNLSRERDRSNRLSRSGREKNNDKISDRRVYVSNIPFEYRWQDLKDLFRNEVGKVARVELFTEDGKPRGCGVVEFEEPGLVEEAVRKMHRYDIKGRKLVVKEDYDAERDNTGRITRERDREDRMKNHSKMNISRQNISMPPDSGIMSDSGINFGNTYGLSPQFLQSLGINGPLTSKVFVANLDYKVDEKKLFEVFKLAGKVLSVELTKDKDGKSRGFGIVEFDHPVESVQAISMLNDQQLYDRRISVRLDRSNESDGPLKLPEGLKGVGMGLGANGNRLTDVSRNLPNLQHNPSTINPLTHSVIPLDADLKSIVSSQLAGILSNTNIAALQASLTGGLGSSLPTTIPLFNSAVTNNLPNQANFDVPLTQPTQPRELDNNRFFEEKAAFSNASYSGGRNTEKYYNKTDIGTAYENNSGVFANSNQVSSGRQNGSDTIYIRNLPSNVTWQMLKEKFQMIADVKFTETKGSGVVLMKFGSEWDAQRAVVLMNNSRINDRIIQVGLC